MAVRLITCPGPGCRAVAEIVDSVVLGSTEGRVETVRTRCLHRLAFVLPINWPNGGSSVRG